MLSDSLKISVEKLEKIGFLDLAVDPTLDLVAEISRLKKRRTPLYSHIIIKRVIYKMLQIILATV